MSTRSNSPLDLVLLIALPVVLLAAIWSYRTVGGSSLVPPGTPLPPLKPVGWLNLPDGEPFDPTGKLVVVDCWATYCPPCLEGLPHLAQVAADYRPLGVEFVGVTPESTRDVEKIEAVIRRSPGFDWPVAYGDIAFINALDIPGFPTVILFGRDGRALWSGAGSYGLEQALDEALAVDDKQP